MNEKYTQTALDYRRIERAIGYLEENFRSQPGLDEIAASVHLSKYHFQRLFKQWAGVTPTQFMHFLTVEYAKERLAASESVFMTSLDAGLSSAGRLHDLFVTFEAVTPGEFKKRGEGVLIRYGFHPTPFGECLIAQTTRGICALRFVSDGSDKQALQELMGEWPLATFVEDRQGTATVVERLFAVRGGECQQPFHLYLKGTNFQVQVWQAPAAARAAASAIARNPVGYLIPCHRVISKGGQIHGYRWGSTRKRAILGWEASRVQEPVGV
jgi:AraC family transcriptional regulator of adaptative response/methylated-DNA-[protein]-cysteine methyltransferase